MRWTGEMGGRGVAVINIIIIYLALSLQVISMNAQTDDGAVDPTSAEPTASSTVTEIPTTIPVEETTIAAPAQPGEIHLEQRGTNSLLLNWTQSQPVTDFKVEVKDQPGSNATVEQDSAESEVWRAYIWQLTVAGQLYEIDVTPLNHDVPGPPQSTEQRTMPPTPALSIDEDSITQTSVEVEISLQNPGEYEISGYRLQWTSNFGDSDSNQVYITGDSHTFQVPGLDQGTTYTFEGWAFSDNVDSDVSGPESMTTLLAPPGSVSVSDASEHTITARWTVPAGNYDAFQLDCTSTAVDAKTFSKRVAKDVFEESCTNLTAGVLYTVSVTSLLDDLDMTSDPTTQQAVTVPLMSEISADTDTTASLTLTLQHDYDSADAQCTHYEIGWRLLEDAGHEGVKTVECSVQTVNLTDLLDDGLYEVNVTTLADYTTEAEDLIQRSQESDNSSAFTLPEQVTDLRVDDPGEVALLVEWTAPDRRATIDQYTLLVFDVETGLCVIEVSLRPDGDPLVKNGTTSTCPFEESIFDQSDPTVSYEVLGLVPHNPYSLEVTPFNPGGGGQSSKVTVWTDQAAPGKVSALNSTTTSSSLTLTWAEPDDPNGVMSGYEVCWRATVDTECIMDPVCEADSAEACDTVQDLTWTRQGLCPYREFWFSVVACNNKSCGAMREGHDSTDEDAPAEPSNIKVMSKTSRSLEVTWDIGPCETGNTSYTVYVEDIEDGTVFPTTVHGFDKTTAEVHGLTPYWRYSISVMAVTGAGNDTGFKPEAVWTEEDVPAPVQSASLTRVDGVCYQMTVTWDLLDRREQHGVILHYIVRIHQDSVGSCVTEYECEYLFGNETTQGLVDVDPNNKDYIFTVSAETSVGEGEASSTDSLSSGTCAPLHPDNEGVGAILPPSQCDGCSKTKQFEVVLDEDFITDTKNGDITESGIIVAQVKDGVIKGEEPADIEVIMEFNDLVDMNAHYPPWSQVKDSNPMSAYRATQDDWQPVSSQATRGRSLLEAGSVVELIGAGEECRDANDGEYCNGYVHSGSSYRVRAFTCTAGGCLATAYSESYFVTESPDDSWIIGLSLGLVFAALLVVVLVLSFFRYRNEQWPFEPKDTRYADTDDDISLGPRERVDSTSVVRRRPVSLNEFDTHTDTMHRNSDLLFADEYKDVKELSAHHSTTASELPQNRTKNRYTNILAFDRSRVKLLPIDDDEGSDYINANYMVGYNSKREFIAAQGPLPATMEDFWRLIWEQNVPMIVMLTRLVERGREKCAQYWPSDNEPHYYGDLQVQMRSESTLDSYTIRVFDVSLGTFQLCFQMVYAVPFQKMGGVCSLFGVQERTVKQLHFLRWPDFGCPHNTELLLLFVADVRTHLSQQQQHQGRPMLVHCSAGVGRTGTFICVDRLLQMIRDHNQVDIFSMVLEMREYRAHMVQTEDQYIYIHDCLRDALEQGLHLGEVNKQYEDNDPEEDNLYENTQFTDLHAVRTSKMI